MKRLIQFMSAAVLITIQGCSFEEMKVEPETPQGETYKVSIHSDIFQQPATKVTTDGFCTGDEVGVYLVNYDGANPGTLKLEDNQADNVKFSYNENGEWVSEYDIFYKDNAKVGERRRVWASCQIDGYTDMAGGHGFRQSNADRMRFKVMHKIYDYEKRFGYPMCVGCGRCDDVCPEYISYSNLVNRLAKEESKA